MTTKFSLAHITHRSVYRKGHKLLGYLLAGTGIFWFAKNAGWIPAGEGPSFFWPTVLTAVGIFIALFASRRRNRDKHAYHAIEKQVDSGVPPA